MIEPVQEFFDNCRRIFDGYGDEQHKIKKVRLFFLAYSIEERGLIAKEYLRLHWSRRTDGFMLHLAFGPTLDDEVWEPFEEAMTAYQKKLEEEQAARIAYLNSQSDLERQDYE